MNGIELVSPKKRFQVYHPSTRANSLEARSVLKRREIGFPDDEIGIMREREREAKFCSEF